MPRRHVRMKSLLLFGKMTVAAWPRGGRGRQVRCTKMRLQTDKTSVQGRQTGFMGRRFGSEGAAEGSRRHAARAGAGLGGRAGRPHVATPAPRGVSTRRGERSDQGGQSRQKTQRRYRADREDPVPGMPGAGSAIVVAGAGNPPSATDIASKFDPRARMRRQRSSIESTASGHGGIITSEAGRRSGLLPAAAARR